MAYLNMEARVETTLNVKGKSIPLFFGSTNPDAKTIKKEFSMDNPLGIPEVKKALEAHYKKYFYTGYTGSVKGFGYPQTNAGDGLEIINKNNTERNGLYFIEKVIVSYEPCHIIRENFITYKIN